MIQKPSLTRTFLSSFRSDNMIVVNRVCTNERWQKICHNSIITDSICDDFKEVQNIKLMLRVDLSILQLCKVRDQRKNLT